MSECANPLAPTSLREHIAVARQIAVTTSRILARTDQMRYVRGRFVRLADHGIRPKEHSYLGLYIKACLGDIYHQLTGSSFTRSCFVMHSMQLLSILSLYDHYIDEAGLSRDERESIFDDLEHAFLRGEKGKSRFRQIARATEITCDFHDEISQLPGAAWYFEQCGELLFSAAREEAFGTPTVEMAVRIGRGTLTAVGGILHAHDPQLPQRHIEAYGSFGAALNLIDDVADFEHDREQGTRTAITAASDVEGTKRYALVRARELFSTCLENLRDDEIPAYMTLASLVRAKWSSTLAYGDLSTPQSAGHEPASQA